MLHLNLIRYGQQCLALCRSVLFCFVSVRSLYCIALYCTSTILIIIHTHGCFESSEALHRHARGSPAPLPALDLVVGLSQHASRRAHKDHVRRAAGAVVGTVEGVAVDADPQTAQNHRCAKDAIVAPDQPDVVLVESQVVLVPQHQGSRRRGRAGAETNLQSQTGHRAGALAELSGLEAAAAAVKSLAALVVVPPAAGVDVVEDLFAHDHLAAAAAQHRSAPATGFLAGRLAHGDLECVAVVEVGAVRRSVFALADLVAAEWFARKTKETHDYWMDG
mmetsp:Transcript_4337/g.12458  ORF Transcript_4337/g.12458 Transcript_4337/m.12458 type:complete len:277 (+) Transcript_4337:971-1801(+)